MDVKSYREKIERELREAGDPGKGKPASETLEMLDQRSDSASARAEAIAETDIDAENIGNLANQYLKTIADTREAVSVRLAALNSLKLMDFSIPNFDGYRSDYHDALRGMVDDASPQVREEAIEVLSISNDTYVKDKLLAGLKNAGEALLPAEKAIQYLSYDEHSEAISTVRSMYDDLKKSAKEQALRMLSSDPESAPLLTRVMKDKSEESSLRCLGAVGLKNINPEAFREAAQEIIGDGEEFDEIRAVCLSALTTGAGKVADRLEDRFFKRVEDIQTKSRNLRSAANRFLDRLR